MRRQTALLALILIAVAFRPSRSGVQSAQAPPVEPGRIIGTVTRAGTADALPEALIVVLRNTALAQPAGPRAAAGGWQSLIGIPSVSAGRGTPGPAAQRGAANQIRATTDTLGQFAIENVQPGQYIVTAQLDGYFAPAIAGTAPAGMNAMRINVTVTERKTTEAHFGLIPGGSISGHIVDSRGRPVVDTAVQAMRLIYQPDGTPTLQGFGNRQTDDRGDYRLFRLPPGEYYLVANPRVTAATVADLNTQTQTRTFFPGVASPTLATPVMIRGGEEVSGANIQIRNIPLAKISGRVTHTIPLEAFDPIQAQRGQPAPALVAAAAADPSLQPLIDEVNKKQAAMQEAQAAMQEARGRLQEARGLRGGVVQPNQRALPVVQLQLVPRDRNALVDPNTGIRSMTAQLGPPNEGRFEMTNVPPGAYDLYASLPDNASYGPQAPPGPGIAGRSFGRIPVDVGDTDVTDVTITVRRGTDVTGQLIVDGRPVAFANAHIVLQPDDSSTRINIYQQVGRSEAQVAANGGFQIPAVPEGAYRVQVTLGGIGPAQRGPRGGITLDAATIQELNAVAQAGGDVELLLAQARGRLAEQNAGAAQNVANAFVADVRQNSASIYDTGIFVGTGAVNPIDIYVETNAGSIAGTVMGANQRPVANAMVVLVPPAARRRNPDLYRTATTNAEGKFTMSGLPPGEFKLFAWPALNGAPYLNPSFMALYEARGSGVSIFAGGQLTAEVPLIPE